MANKATVFRHVNEDHVVPELQFLERLHRLVVAAEAMDRELRLDAGSGMANGFRRLAALPFWQNSANHSGLPARWPNTLRQKSWASDWLQHELPDMTLYARTATVPRARFRSRAGLVAKSPSADYAWDA